MIKLKAAVAGKDHDISIRREGADVYAEIEGQHYELQFQDLSGGEYLLIEGYSVYHCRVESHRQPDDIEVRLGGHRYAIKITDPKRLRSAQSSREHDKGTAQIVAPMPGKVVRLLVEVGMQVEAGAGVLVVEAMKMQNEMKTPRAGTVVALHTEAGATVNAGDVLAVIE